MDKYINQIINADCLDILKQLPDKCIDLVLTDPPYGINCDGGDYGLGVSPKKLQKKEWDNGIPQKHIFDEIFSEMDVDSEGKILSKIFGYLADKTILVISHRDNNNLLFDKCFTIKNGKIYNGYYKI